jgi:hypothetical protein
MERSFSLVQNRKTWRVLRSDLVYRKCLVWYGKRVPSRLHQGYGLVWNKVLAWSKAEASFGLEIGLVCILLWFQAGCDLL